MSSLNTLYCIIPLICMFADIALSSIHQLTPRRKPIIEENPKDTFAVRKHSLSLHCRAEGEPPPLILWYKDNKLVTSLRDKPGTSNNIINAEELLFTSFNKEDEGIYYCNASNSEGWVRSMDARLQLAFLDPIISGPVSKIVSIGDSISLNCKIPHGIPAPVIEWFHNTVPVKLSNRLVVDSGNLHIKNVYRQDAGSYQCIARNLAEKRESSSAILTVYQRPHFKVKPSNQKIKIGDDVEFSCHVIGDPKPSILWRRENGFSIPESRSILHEDKSLRLLRLRVEDDGIYVCQAKNAVGSIEASARLIVLSPPSFTLTPVDTSVLVGEKAILNCHATGSPVPFIRWIHNGQYYTMIDHLGIQNIKYPRVYVNSKGSLIISETRKSDEGKYECRASQNSGMVRSSANLLVNDFDRQPIVVIDLGPQNETLGVGAIANFYCKAYFYELNAASKLNYEIFKPSELSLSISWYKNGKQISSLLDPRITVSPSGNLQIHDVNLMDEGNYTCRAEANSLLHQKNDFNIAEWTSSLSVTRMLKEYKQEMNAFIHLPHPPTSVDIIDVGDNWISLRCLISINNGLAHNTIPSNNFHHLSKEKHKHSSRVRIEYFDLKENQGWQLAGEAISNEIFRINDLKPESAYQLLVRTIQDNTVGPAYIPLHAVYTRPQVRFVDFSYPTSSIRSLMLSPLNITSLSTSEIQIIVALCGDPTTIQLATGIKFTYRSVSLNSCLSKQINLPLNSPNYLYSLCVDQNNPYFKKKSLIEVLNSISDNYCSLQFVSDKTSAYWETSKYLLFYDNKIQQEKIRFIELQLHSASTFKIILNNLLPFVCYEIKAEVYSERPHLGKVYSPVSYSSTVLTFESTPIQPPQEIRARWIEKNKTVLEIMWAPPPLWSINGLITGYSLRILECDNQNSETFHVDSTKTIHRIENLKPNTNFTLYLATLTCQGEGVRSEPHPIIALSYLKLMGRNSSDFFPYHQLSKQPSGYGTKNPSFNLLNYTPGIKSLGANDHNYNQPVSNTQHIKAHSSKTLPQQAWFIACVIGLIIIWATLCILLLFMCRRRRQVKQRCSQNNPSEVKVMNGVGGVSSDTNFSNFSLQKTNAYTQNNQTSKICLLQSNNTKSVKPKQRSTDFLSKLLPTSKVNESEAYTRICGDFSECKLDDSKHPSLGSHFNMTKPQIASGCNNDPPDTFSPISNHLNDLGYQASVLDTATQSQGCDTGVKFTSTGSIFLATGRTPSSSSNDSSLHKGAGEASIDDTSALCDSNCVTPYASTSLIEQLRCQGIENRLQRKLHSDTSEMSPVFLPFGNSIPPPPRYPPPPIPESPTLGNNIPSNSSDNYNRINQNRNEFKDDECHYAQSDIHRAIDAEQYLIQQQLAGVQNGINGPMHSNTSVLINDSTQPQCAPLTYLPVYNGSHYPPDCMTNAQTPAGICLLQSTMTIPNEAASSVYMPHVLTNGTPIFHAPYTQNQPYIMQPPMITLKKKGHTIQTSSLNDS